MERFKSWLIGALLRGPLGARAVALLFGTAVVAVAAWLVDAGLLGGEVLDALRLAFGL